jgi:hypothetical protein
MRGPDVMCKIFNAQQTTRTRSGSAGRLNVELDANRAAACANGDRVRDPARSRLSLRA